MKVNSKSLKDFQNQQLPSSQLKSVVGGDGGTTKIEIAVEKLEVVL